jgi:excinuclease ABC subunit C
MDKIESIEFIKQKIKNLGDATGCYLWKNQEKEVIYVGKAIRLSDRIRSYLNPKHQDQKTLQLQSEIFDLEWIITNSEHEALILEANLIKRYNPKYNVRLKDDKKYPFICVSTDELFPMVFITRKVKADGKKYFGPYTDVKATREFLNLIHRIFPIRKTPLKLPLAKPAKPCLNFHIKRCLAPCTGEVKPEDYQSMIQVVIRFLEGRRDGIVSDLREKMIELSESMQFERAALYRNMIQSINTLSQKQTIINNTLGDEDILALAKSGLNGEMVVFEIRGGRLEGKKSFALDGVADTDDWVTYLTFLKLYYFQSSFAPERIRVPLKQNSEVLSLEKSISRIFEKMIKIQRSDVGSSASIYRLALKNAEMNLTERILATKLREEKTALKQIQEIFHLPKIPDIIECYDISHFQGAEPVGSGVQFIKGKPNKSGYRHYSIRGYKGINDPGMIHEVISRRLSRILNDSPNSIPDLIVIDGGETQLSRATEAAVALGLENLPMVGLAKKKEEIYFPGEKEPYRFDIDSPAIRLLRQIRDEAHRFGIQFHRKKRNQNTLRSALDSIPELGKLRKQKIISKLLQKKRIKEITQADLESLDGIGKVLALKILTHLQSKD